MIPPHMIVNTSTSKDLVICPKSDGRELIIFGFGDENSSCDGSPTSSSLVDKLMSHSAKHSAEIFGLVTSWDAPILQ